MIALAFALILSRGHTPLLTGQLIPEPTNDALSCSGATVLFPWTTPAQRGDGTDTVEWWGKTYHTTVDAVVTEAVNQLGQTACDPLQTPATPLLIQLQQQVRANVDATSTDESIVGQVLRRYLQLYQCSLQSRSALLAPAVSNDVRPAGQTDLPLFSPSSSASFFDGQFLRILLQERVLIDRETTTAPLTLNRAMFLLTRALRAQGLQQQWQCVHQLAAELQKKVKDAMEANACLLNASGSLDSSASSDSSPMGNTSPPATP